ncbi:phosphopantetheine-binding protein [Couchioplanes caeruleus]|uniref:phosphopantetheine-binding protein n=1 Tax=Couchioplanes caeruleus TaxID=56438 RepID=UPI0020BE5D57|nr:phosphopantetheine-binding protein [Couchioplanes caeruleus]UQU67748.1 phosphopantetheine-binding protein [Couchioplanes caeruleus]
MSDDLRARLLAVLTEELSIDPATVRDDSDLVADLGFDSVAFSVGSVAIEESIGVRVPISDLMECLTFGDLTALVQKAERP